jgi:hypothetical protein
MPPGARLKQPVSCWLITEKWLFIGHNWFGIISLQYCRMKRPMSEEAVIKKLQKSAWYKALSEKVRARVDAYPPTKRYRMKATGRIVTLVSYGEDTNGDCNTVTVEVSREDNPGILFEREVFGVEFDELEVVTTPEDWKN